MSAPVGERTRTAARGATARGATRTRSTTIPAQRSGPAATPRTGEGAPSALRGGRSQQAYAGREERARRAPVSRPVRTAASPRRPQFVLLVMVLLAVGLVATLWLSTAAAAGSYHLQAARVEALGLSQQSERLHREVADLESAPELARRAEALGMVPVQDSARLVVAPDGSVTVVGQPRAAVAPPPPPPPPAPAQPAPGAGTPAARGAGGPGSANESTTSGDLQEPADSGTGAQGDASTAGTQGQAAGAGAQGDTSTGAQGGASTEGTTGGTSTQGASGNTSTSGATDGTSTQGTSGDTSTSGATGGTSTSGTGRGASTQGATGGATTQGTGGATTQGTGGADGTGNG